MKSNLALKHTYHLAPNKGRVLLLEDDGSQRYLIEMILGRGGYQATAITCREEFDALVSTRQLDNFDVLVLDIALPAFSGFDAAQIARDEYYSGISISTSARFDSNLYEESIRSGCNAHLDKFKLVTDLVPTIDREMLKRTTKPISILSDLRSR